jgi:aryl-alcohol dehydrogenase-like predicted oxidoreductase
MQMEFHALGKSGLKVSAIGLGCMPMSQSYGARNDVDSLAALDRAVELGITFWDTADVYGNGHNEKLLGKSLRQHRARVIVGSKCGVTYGSDNQPLGVNGRPEYIRSACDASLQRLETDFIDLYYLHRVDPMVPIEDSVGAFADLVRAGKIRYIGLSEASPSTLRRACKVHPIAALQSEYSLWFRDAEAEVIPACRELGIGLVPFCPLGRGILTGNISTETVFPSDDARSRLPRFQGENLRHNLKLVDNLQRLATKRGCAASQLALAWLLAKGPDIAPIPGTKRAQYMEENAAATSIHLTSEEVRTIESQVQAQAAVGERYTPAQIKLLDRS